MTSLPFKILRKNEDLRDESRPENVEEALEGR